MAGKHSLKDLAPRHIVAKEIFRQRVKGNVCLFGYHADSMDLNKSFRPFLAMCQTNGIAT